MANLGINFDTSSAPPRQDFTPIPDGLYKMMIVDSIVKPKRGTTGKPGDPGFEGFLELEAEVQQGEHEGRKVFIRLNLWNHNEKTETIAKSEFNELSAAVGKGVVKDSGELHDIMFDAKVAIKKGSPYTDPNGVEREGNSQNVIRKYIKSNGSFSGYSSNTINSAAKAGPWATATKN